MCLLQPKQVFLIAKTWCFPSRCFLRPNLSGAQRCQTRTAVHDEVENLTKRKCTVARLKKSNISSYARFAEILIAHIYLGDRLSYFNANVRIFQRTEEPRHREWNALYLIDHKQLTLTGDI